MPALVTALYAEGHSDERFLPVLIQRTAEQILSQHGLSIVDVFEPAIVGHSVKLPTRQECILAVAQHSVGYHLLVVHADADHPSRELAYSDRFLPGLNLVQAPGSNACQRLVPIIPVQSTEAWMLADGEALVQVIGTDLSAAALGLPVRAHQVESDPDPKRSLNEVVRRALADRPRRRRRFTLRSIHEPLARQVRLSVLDQVPSYQQFAADLRQALVELNFAR